jgi:phenylacetate-CoA ligase
MIWNESVECAEPRKLKELQSQRLSKLVEYIYSNCEVYSKMLDAAKIGPASIKSIDDIKRLPFTEKSHMRDNYPYGLFSASSSDVVEIHVSSGTTGNPTVVGYTRDDLKLWSEVMARALCCAGAEPGDTLQNAYGYGLFTGGLGLHYGGVEMGCKVIPMSSGQTARQLKIMQDFKPRILSCTPSYSLFMAEEAKEMGMDPRQTSWQIGVFGAEPWSDQMRREIEETLGILATDIYGLSEIIGPGVAQECRHKDGLHIFSDVFFPEIIDPNTGDEMKAGEVGELVITTLTKQAIPLLRYRTRDLVSISYEKCRCGRTLPRISKIRGRTDDMIIVRGINVFPSQIEHVLLSIDGTHPHYQLVVDRKAHQLDDLEVMVEVDEKIFSDEVKKLHELQEKIKKEIQAVLSVGVKVTLVEPKTIERSLGKAVRVIDKRQVR